MLGKTAGGLYWMFRFLERAENSARLVEAGFRIALTRSNDAETEWRSIIMTTASKTAYEEKHDSYSSSNVIDFLLRDTDNPNSVFSVVRNARDNARLVRTALTSEVWFAVNDTWMLLSELLSEPVEETELHTVLATIKQQSGLVRGALHGTMLRNDIFYFCCLAIAIERLDNTARIIDVKYYSLLPPASVVGSRIDNVQWETILRSVSAHRSFRWAVEEDYNAPSIANFLILDRQMPRSMAFCADQIIANIRCLETTYGERAPSHDLADALMARMDNRKISSIFDEGLHQFVGNVITDTAGLATQIERDYRFVRK